MKYFYIIIDREMKYGFGNIVIVEGNMVGVVVKVWNSFELGVKYEIYVRSLNGVKEYKEEQIMRFIYDKELSEESLEFYN